MRHELERARQLRREYDEAVVQEGKELAGPFMTVSSRPIERLYDPTDVEGIDYERDINPVSYTHLDVYKRQPQKVSEHRHYLLRAWQWPARRATGRPGRPPTSTCLLYTSRCV